MGKWIKKVSTVKLDERAKVIDDLAGNQVKHAPSIHIVNEAFNDIEAYVDEMESSVDEKLDTKANASHTHAFSDISGLTFSLSGTTLTITKS